MSLGRAGRTALLIVLAAVAVMVGCRKQPENEARRRTLMIAVAAEPHSLLPPFAADLVSGQLCDLIYGRLAEPVAGFSTVGDRDYRPGLASGWTWAPDSLSLRFTLDPRARWHDGVPITSRDVQFTFAVLRDSTAHAARAWLSDVLDSVTTPDAHSAVLWAHYRSRTFFHDVTYPVHILPAHVLDTIPRSTLASHPINRRPIGSGRFRVVGWTPNTQIELAAVRGSAEGPLRVLVRVWPSYDAALLALLTGDADVMDYVRPDDVARLEQAGEVTVLRLPGFSYGVLQFNLRPRSQSLVAKGSGNAHRGHPLFVEPRLRRAVAMSIDRSKLVANILGTSGWVSAGPFTRAMVTADTTIGGPAYDPRAAERLLDSLGWQRTAPGAVRSRRGHPLRFSVLVPASSATRLKAAVLVQHMLAEVGIAVDIDAREAAATGHALTQHDFDAALTNFRADPDPANVRDVWGSASARTGDGFNFGGYVSEPVDRALDAAARASTAAEARTWYTQAYHRIVDDVPAVFLYEPVALVAHNRRWGPVGVRPDAWWASLADWRRLEVR